MFNESLDLLVSEFFLPSWHGGDFPHECAAFLDDQIQVLIGHLCHVFLIGQGSNVRAEAAAVPLTAVAPVAVTSGAHLIEYFFGVIRIGLCR